jgi:chromosome segregation ATPase
VSITDDMMGGEWEQLVRHLRVEAGPWIQPRHITFRLHSLDNTAKAADRGQSLGALHNLEQAIGKLDREVQQYQHELERFRKEVGYLTAAVHQAITLAKQKPAEASRSDGLDEDAVAEWGHQATKLYGTPKRNRGLQ